MSTNRGCRIRQTEPNTWVLELESLHHREEWTMYGPFHTATAADEYLKSNFANPGGMMVMRLEGHECKHSFIDGECSICWTIEPIGTY